jgi:uncharacterized protein (DUF3084 family)
MTFDVILKAGSVVVAISGIGAGYYALDQTYARESKVAGVERRLDQKIIGDRKDQLQQEYWKLQDRYGANCEKGSKEIQDRCRTLLEQLKDAQDELDALRKK